MNQGLALTLRLLVAVGILSMTASALADNSGCDCWYGGYEDGLEFTWGTRFQSQEFDDCQQEGLLNPYEDGFHAAEQRGERSCPYGG
jgi:hypothetical protein